MNFLTDLRKNMRYVFDIDSILNFGNDEIEKIKEKINNIGVVNSIILVSGSNIDRDSLSKKISKVGIKFDTVLTALDSGMVGAEYREWYYINHKKYIAAIFDSDEEIIKIMGLTSTFALNLEKLL